MRFNIFSKKKPDDIFDALLEGTSNQPYDLTQILQQQKIMMDKISAVGAVVDKHFEALEKDKQALENSSAAFRERMASSFGAAAADDRRREEETSLWQSQGCPTTTAVTVMKPLKLNHAGFTAMVM